MDKDEVNIHEIRVGIVRSLILGVLLIASIILWGNI